VGLGPEFQTEQQRVSSTRSTTVFSCPIRARYSVRARGPTGRRRTCREAERVLSSHALTAASSTSVSGDPGPMSSTHCSRRNSWKL
jgi:hypothetical protein